MSVRVPDERLAEQVTGLDGPIDKALWLLGEGRLRGWTRLKIDEVVAGAAAERAALVADLRAARADNQRLREALDRVFYEELNGRICPLPETDEDRCCPNCRETWSLVRAALAEEPRA